MKNSLQIATDGSHIPNTLLGAGAAVLADENKPQHEVKVGAQCLLEEGMSSLTPEQYGIVGGLIALALLIHDCDTPHTKVKVQMWVDNKESLDRANSSFDQRIRLREFQVSNYGVMMIMQQMIREQCNVKYRVNPAKFVQFWTPLQF